VGKDQTVPYGTDFRLDLFQAINCLATIIRSLRDNRAVIPVGHKPDTPRRDENEVARHFMPGYDHRVPTGQNSNGYGTSTNSDERELVPTVN